MASQYLQQLDAITSTLGTYLIPISDDPSGVGRLKKITFTNLLGGTLGSAAYTASSAYDAAGAAAAVVSDIAYDATSWNGVTGIAPSKNAVRDYLNTLGTAAFVNIGTDTTLAANSDSIVATQKATKAYVDAMVTGLLEFKGSVDCSANPNYSSANKGDAYYVSVAGKIGGASGETVEVGDVIVASADNAGGTEASVGTSWFVMEHNLVGAAVTSGTLAQFAATTSAQLAGVISDETGSGSLVFATSPTLVTPVLGVASATSLTVTGTSGAGYLALIGQASTPAEPAAGTMLIYSETEQGFTRLRQHNEEITNLILGQDNAFIVQNTSGASIAKGSVVYVTGSTGHTPNVSKAQANSSVTTPAIGVLVDAIANNGYGQAMFTGVLSGIDTSTLVSGDPIFLSTTVAGGLTTTRPSGTTNIVQAIGTVLVVGVGNGEIKIAIAPALLNTETGTNAATWTGSAVVATSLACPTFTSAAAMGFTPASGSNFNVNLATTGDFAVNTNQLYVDTSAGNVGIGTTSPSARIHAISTTEQLRLGYDSSNYTSFTASSIGVCTITPTGSSPLLYLDGKFHVGSYSLTNYAVLVYQNSSAGGGPAALAVRQDGSDPIQIWQGSGGGVKAQLNYDGNFGIGTTSPLARLHAISTTEQLRLGYDASNYYSTTVSSAGAVTFDALGASAGFTFSDAVTATSLACPTFTSAAAMGFTPASGSGFNVNLGASGGTVTVDTSVHGTQRLLNLYNSEATAGGQGASVKLGGFNNGVGGAIITATTNLSSNSATTFTIETQNVSNVLNTVFFGDYNGNVGIGTTSPASLFTVNQTANTTDGTQATYGFQLSLSGTTNLTMGANATYTYLQSWASKPLVVNSQGNNTLLNPTSGDVGIGTTTVSAKLHTISTTEQLRLGYDASNYYSTTVSSAGAVTFNAVGASSGFTFSDAVTVSVATPLVTFKPTANNQDCGLKVLDSVGATAGYLSIVPNTIGTNSKFYLYVGGPAAADIKMTVDDDGVTNIKRDASNYCTITPSSVGLITFDAVGSGAAFTFADNVSVTNTAGDCIVTATGGTPSTTAGDGYLLLASSRTDTGVGHVCKLRSVAPSAGKADLAFLTQPSNGVYTERMRIDNAGYVGIGTTAPTSALSVVGIVKMEASSQRRPALTSSNFGYSANYRTLMLGSSSTTYNTADTGAVTLAFGVDVSANAGGSFTGDGSELLFRNVAHFTTPNAGNTSYQQVMTFNNSNVGIGVGSSAFGTSAASVFGIKNGTEPSTSPADMIQLYSVDLSAGNATLGLRTETAVVTESVTSDRTLSIRINGTTYKLCLKA